jgi:uncharacterized protein YjdB
MRKFVLVSIILNIFLAACSLILVSTDPKLEDVTLNYSSYELFINEDLELHTIAHPSKATVAVYDWYTSNDQIAIVDSRGYVQAKGVGDCVITVKVNGGKILSCVIKVLPIVANSVDLSVEYTTISVGYSQAIDCQVTPYNTTFKDVTWTSSNSEVVSVDADGNMIGVSAGVATITAEVYGGISETITITVQDEILPQELNLNKSSVELLRGKSTSISYTVLPKTVTNSSVTYVSSNTDVATVSSAGTIVAVSNGSATITVRTANGIERSVFVTVTDIPATQVIVTNQMDFMSSKLSLGQRIQIQVKMIPFNTTTRVSDLTYESRDTTVATVSDSGVVAIVDYGHTVIFIKLGNETLAFIDLYVLDLGN